MYLCNVFFPSSLINRLCMWTLQTAITSTGRCAGLSWTYTVELEAPSPRFWLTWRQYGLTPYRSSLKSLWKTSRCCALRGEGSDAAFGWCGIHPYERYMVLKPHLALLNISTYSLIGCSIVSLLRIIINFVLNMAISPGWSVHLLFCFLPLVLQMHPSSPWYLQPPACEGAGKHASGEYGLLRYWNQLDYYILSVSRLPSRFRHFLWERSTSVHFVFWCVLCGADVVH